MPLEAIEVRYTGKASWSLLHLPSTPNLTCIRVKAPCNCSNSTHHTLSRMQINVSGMRSGQGSEVYSHRFLLHYVIAFQVGAAWLLTYCILSDCFHIALLFLWYSVWWFEFLESVVDGCKSIAFPVARVFKCVALRLLGLSG